MDGDHLAVIGENRKLLCFPLDQVPEMGRGKGVRLQKYKDGGISDLKSFRLAEGLTWLSSDGRTYTVGRPEIDEWIGRARRGRPPAAEGLSEEQQVRGVSGPPRRRREAGLQAECVTPGMISALKPARMSMRWLGASRSCRPGAMGAAEPTGRQVVLPTEV